MAPPPPPPPAPLMSPAWAPNIFEGKVVLCTGGAGDICSAQVSALVALGANASIIGRNPAKTHGRAGEIAALRPGARCIGIVADVRDAAAMERAVERTVGELGAVDYVICGAAGNFLATTANLSANAFKAVMDIDVLGSYNTVKAALPELKRTRGKILFVSATLHYTGLPYQAHVSAAKAAIDALSQVLCVELGPHGITSNCIAPGPIENTAGMTRLSRPDALAAVARTVPLQRLGTVGEIADATVFLLGPAGDFVSGTTLVVDGGAWHRQGAAGSGVSYPESVLTDAVVDGVQGRRRGESKL